MSTKRSLAFVLLAGCAGCGSAGGSAPPSSSDTELSVEATNPANGAVDALRNGQIWLRFSEPVLPSSVRLVTKPKAPLSLRSAEAGDRELTYELSESLSRLTKYRVQVEAQSADGEQLDPPYAFSFTTGIEPRPEVEQPPLVVVSPSNGTLGVSLTPQLSFSFSKPMERSSVERGLQLEPEATCDELSWNDEGTLLECAIAEALSPDTTYTITLDASARSEDGAPLDEAFTSTFATRRRPVLVSTLPADGDVVGGVEGTFELTFAPGTSMDQSALESAFRYLSPAGHPVLGASCFFEKCTITTSQPFSEQQQVSWELTTDAVDNAGVALGANVSGSFSVGRRLVTALPAAADLDGDVTEGGVVDAAGSKLSVGRNANEAVRTLLSFDLAQLPPDMLALSKATLQLNHEASTGAPNGLGSLLVYSVEYGASLQSSAFDVPVYAYDTCNLLLQCTKEALDAGLALSSGNLWTSPVTRLVQHDLDAQAARSQMRISFTKDTTVTSAGAQVFTSANAAANRPTLSVEYWAP